MTRLRWRHQLFAPVGDIIPVWCTSCKSGQQIHTRAFLLSFILWIWAERSLYFRRFSSHLWIINVPSLPQSCKHSVLVSRRLPSRITLTSVHLFIVSLACCFRSDVGADVSAVAAAALRCYARLTKSSSRHVALRFHFHVKLFGVILKSRGVKQRADWLE